MIINGTHMAAIEPTERTETNGMRALWAEVALRVIWDERRIISAAREGKRIVTLGGGGGKTQIFPFEVEIDRAHRYFRSPDWRQVCALAGIEVDADRMMQIVCADPAQEVA